MVRSLFSSHWRGLATRGVRGLFKLYRLWVMTYTQCKCLICGGREGFCSIMGFFT